MREADDRIQYFDICLKLQRLKVRKKESKETIKEAIKAIQNLMNALNAERLSNMFLPIDSYIDGRHPWRR